MGLYPNRRQSSRDPADAAVVTHRYRLLLKRMKSIHARDVSRGTTDHFIPRQFWNTTNIATVPIWCARLWFLFATPAGKPFRMLGVARECYVENRNRNTTESPSQGRRTHAHYLCTRSRSHSRSLRNRFHGCARGIRSQR